MELVRPTPVPRALLRYRSRCAARHLREGLAQMNFLLTGLIVMPIFIFVVLCVHTGGLF
jgi:hypothetical protein